MRYNTREAKLEILTNAWHKLLGQLLMANTTVMSKKASTMIFEIGKLPHKIVRAALEEYLRCSQRVHTIAFLQWRMKFPSHIKYNQAMLIELIEERMKFMYGLLHVGMGDKSKMPSKQYGVNE